MNSFFSNLPYPSFLAKVNPKYLLRVHIYFIFFGLRGREQNGLVYFYTSLSFFDRYTIFSNTKIAEFLMF